MQELIYGLFGARKLRIFWFQWSIVTGCYICTWWEAALINLFILFVVLLVMLAAWKQVAYLVGFMHQLAPSEVVNDHNYESDRTEGLLL